MKADESSWFIRFMMANLVRKMLNSSSRAYITNLSKISSISMGKKVIFSFLDQGLFSGANFLLNLLLARWLTQENYGAFSVAFSIFLLLAGLQTSLILEPMVVFGSVNHIKKLPEYLGEISVYQVGLTTSFSLLLIFAGNFLDSAIQASFMGLAFSLPFILFFWLMRQACYIESRTELAAKGSCLYAFTLTLGTYFIYINGQLTTFSTFLLMGACGGIASVFLWRTLKVNIILKINMAIIRENLGYGKWIILASIASWVIFWIYPPLLSTFAGLSQAGSFKAMQNFILPLQQGITAISLFLLPLFSRQYYEHGLVYLHQEIKLVSAFGAIISVIYTILLMFAGPFLVNLIYLSQDYKDSIWLLPFLGFSIVLFVPGQFMGLTFRAMGQSSKIFWSKAISAIFILTIGTWVIITNGLMGVAFSLILGSLIETIACFFLYIRNLKKA